MKYPSGLQGHVIDGSLLARQFSEKTKGMAELFQSRTGIFPCMAVIIVGHDAASEIYVRNKIIHAHKMGITCHKCSYPSDCSEAELLTKIKQLNVDPTIHGILVQLPLPKHISVEAILSTINPAKDIDALTPENVASLVMGYRDDVLMPCTPWGCLLLIQSVVPQLRGKNALIIGASNLVGKPMAALLLQHGCTVTIAHSKTVNLKLHSLQAEIIVVATGVVKLLKPDMIKNDVVIIDVGINRITNDIGYKIEGDVDFYGCLEKVAYITPVPNGVGPMTVACLLRNIVICAARMCDIKVSSLS